MHEPQTECIAKGKTHKRFEFGVQTGLVTSARANWVLGAQTFPGNPYGGHTLQQALEQAKRITGVEPEQACADLGYRKSGYLLPFRPPLDPFASPASPPHAASISRCQLRLAKPVWHNQLDRAFCENVWPQGLEVRHSVAPKFIARLEAAPPEAARQTATVI